MLAVINYKLAEKLVGCISNSYVYQSISAKEV